jgi:hypothetical protein
MEKPAYELKVWRTLMREGFDDQHDVLSIGVWNKDTGRQITSPLVLSEEMSRQVIDPESLAGIQLYNFPLVVKMNLKRTPGDR